MELVIRPIQDPTHPDRALACEEAMDYALRDIVDAGNAAGWSTLEMLAAIDDVIPHMRRAYEQDPDPADDPV